MIGVGEGIRGWGSSLQERELGGNERDGKGIGGKGFDKLMGLRGVETTIHVRYYDRPLITAFPSNVEELQCLVVTEW